MGIKVNKDLVTKVFGVVASVAGIISTVNGMYSEHKEKQDAKLYKEKIDNLEKVVEGLTSKNN